MFLYPAVIFLSAVLLFQIQPMIAKAILPWFGGSAAVWTTCMLFFQLILLLGYVYAHVVTTKLSPRWQMVVHSVLVGVSVVLLPVTPDTAWRPSGAEQPVTNLLGALATAVGLPYFLLSTTSPLLQAWYARAKAGALPYRLFSVSNAASLLGLLAYPFVIEPFVSTQMQLLGWSVGYGTVAVLLIVAAVRSARHQPVAVVTPEAAVVVDDARISFGEKFMWVALPACASTMLLAFTGFLSQDVAPLPFLWIVPLSCYLLTFVVCFGRESVYKPKIMRWALVPSFALMVAAMQGGWDKQLLVIVPLTISVLLAGCFFCHGELVRLKPRPRYLTSYYLAISAGGALGGVFVGLVAPVIFGSYAELPISVASCALLALCLARGGTATGHIAVTAVVIVLMAAQFAVTPTLAAGAVEARNFYGALKVTEEPTANGTVRKLYHGSILHGIQFMPREKQAIPTAYYGTNSAAGLALKSLPAGPRRVGIVGLGVGTMAAYARSGDYYRFYDINPLVVKFAREEFSFLRNCPARHDVVLGDARLSLEREPAQEFDFLALDAFSGDSIPVHLLTAEAFQTYFRHLKPGGVLAVHTSNIYLNLAQVVAAACEPMGKVVRAYTSAPDDSRQTQLAQWVIVADNASVFEQGELRGAERPERKIGRWTDQSSNLLSVLRW